MSNLEDITTLQKELQRVWDVEPQLQPQPDMHDYPLTYPPAIQLARPSYAKNPTSEELQQFAIGNHTAAAYYFHFGFCKYRCRYCFHYELSVKKDEDLMKHYVEALEREMQLFRSRYPNLKTGLFFLGGGTPTALPSHLLERFLKALHRNFGPPPTTMSTVEAKPITVDSEKLRLLVDAGFRRINLGVQTLDPQMYSFHHHKEDVQVAIDSIIAAKHAGFSYINIDIMTGLEGQTPQKWEYTLKKIRGLIEERLIDSVFIYPFHDDPRSVTYQNRSRVPSFIETAHSDALAREMFEGLGWKELGARFYRSPRHVRREIFELAKTRINPAYGEVLYHGFGNSSFSIGDRATYVNHRDIHQYCQQVEQGQLGISHWTTITDAQRATRDITFDLLYAPITRVRSRQRKYGREYIDFHTELMDKWIALGLGQKNRLLGTFSLTKLGKLLHQQMIPFHYLPSDKEEFWNVMGVRKEQGKKYRGY